MNISSQANILALMTSNKLVSLSKPKLHCNFDLNKETSFIQHVVDTPEINHDIEIPAFMEFECAQEVVNIL